MNTMKTRLNMLFILVLSVKIEFAAMLRMLSNSKNAKRGLEGLGGATNRYMS